MATRVAPALLLIVNVLASVMCMLPVASMQKISMDHVTDEHMEMAMTPAIPMSSLDCDGCVKISAPESSPMQHAGCNGHCIMRPSSMQAYAHAPNDGIFGTALRYSVTYRDMRNSLLQAYATQSPAPPLALKPETIVLRL